MNAPMSRRQALFGIIGAGGTVVGALVPTASAEEHPAHPVAPLDAVAKMCIRDSDAESDLTNQNPDHPASCRLPRVKAARILLVHDRLFFGERADVGD